MEQKRAVLQVVVHDDGKHYHIRPLTTTMEEGAGYQCNRFERIVRLYEIFRDESIVHDDDVECTLLELDDNIGSA